MYIGCISISKHISQRHVTMTHNKTTKLAKCAQIVQIATRNSSPCHTKQRYVVTATPPGDNPLAGRRVWHT